MKINHIHPNYENSEKQTEAIEKIFAAVYGNILSKRENDSKAVIV